jgi:hypothetical protein
MEMDKDILTSLFDKARNAKLETSHHEVYRWIGYFSFLAFIGVLLSKIKILFTKSFIMYTTILTSAAIVVGTIAYNFTESNQNQSASMNASNSIVKSSIIDIEKYAEPLDSVVTKHLPIVAHSNSIFPDHMVEEEHTFLMEGPIEHRLQQDETLAKIEVSQVLANAEFNDYGEFDNLNVNGSARVILVQGNSFGARIEGNAAEVSLKTVKGVKTLVVSSSSVRNNNNSDATIVYVSVKDLKTIITSDAARVSGEGTDFKFDQLAIESHDASRVELKLTSKNLSINCSDASRITLSGSTNELTVVSSDAARLSAFELKTNSVNAVGKDASRIEVFVTKELNIKLEDASRLDYMGNPKSFNSISKGASKVEKVD